MNRRHPPEGPPDADAPSGTVTFLFTDIEGSTLRWDRMPAEMREAVALHDAVLRKTISTNRGRIFKTIGDQFCAVFRTANDAIEAAIVAQRHLMAEDFGAVNGLRVRMALHSGAAEERDDDYFGPVVNRVSRLLAAAHGGQVVLSVATRSLLAESLRNGIEFYDLGEHRLKDLIASEHVFQLAVPGLQSEFASLRSLSVLDNNLPRQLTSLLGREADVGMVRSLLRRGRLTTITGAGGVGKTRLALQVAAELLDGSGDGVWFVDFAPLQDASFVPSAIAAALGMQETGSDVLVGLLRHLAKRRLLLVLDNCEHVVGEAARVSAMLLASCPDIYIIATSRELLNIAGEHVYRVPSLALPPLSCDTADALLAFPACALFAERAASASLGFRCTDRDAPIIGEICRRLDGIPLAIELAATRVRILSPSSLAHKLDERFAILTGGSRTSLPRQQTMRAMLDWSFNLLDSEEQLLFLRTAIFAGSFSLESAERVCSDEDLAAEGIMSGLASLVDKSLMVPDPGQNESRFRLLESTKAYALEKIVGSSQSEKVARRHCEWVGDWAALAFKAAHTQPLHVWLEHVMPELDNIRAALTWGLGPRGNSRLAGAIAGSLGPLWYEGRLQAEGRRWVEVALERVDEYHDPLVASRLWRVLAHLNVAKRTVDAALRSIALAQSVDDLAGIAAGHLYLGYGYWQTGELAKAEEALSRALTLYRDAEMQHTSYFATALDTQAQILLNAGRFSEARVHSLASFNCSAALNDDLGQARSRANLAELEFACENTELALQQAEKALHVFRERGLTAREATVLVNIAAYRLTLAMVEEASTAAREGLVIARRIEDEQLCTVAIQQFAAIAALRGEFATARRLLSYVDGWYRVEGYAREWNERRVLQIIAGAMASSEDGIGAQEYGPGRPSLAEAMTEALSVASRALDDDRS